MKLRIFSILFLAIPILSFSQDIAKKHPYFIALYTIGEHWDLNKQPNEQPYFKEHSVFLSNLRADGTITIGARYGDTGMVVIKASDIEMAKSILMTDKAVENKLFKIEIHPFSPFYKGCLE